MKMSMWIKTHIQIGEDDSPLGLHEVGTCEESVRIRITQQYDGHTLKTHVAIRYGMGDGRFTYDHYRYDVPLLDSENPTAILRVAAEVLDTLRYTAQDLQTMHAALDSACEVEGSKPMTDHVDEVKARAVQLGLDSRHVEQAVNILHDRAQDALDGVQSMIDTFAYVGIDVGQLKGKSPEDLFGLFAVAVSSAPNILLRNAAIVRLLGDDLARRIIPVVIYPMNT